MQPLDWLATTPGIEAIQAAVSEAWDLILPG